MSLKPKFVIFADVNKKDKMPNNKIVAFDKLRIVAAFAVVVLHTVAPLFMDLYPSSDWSVANMYESLVR